MAFERGDNPFRIFTEISLQGGGMKKFYTSYEGFVFKTLAYNTA